MPTLYLLRHAKSSWDDPALADHERPLAPKGRRDGKLMAKHVKRAGIAPSLVLCSSAVRTRETLELVRKALGAPAAEIEDGLYGARAETLLRRLQAVPDETQSVLVLGHNPGLQDLAVLLAATGEELEGLRTKLPTAALATLTVPTAPWSALEAGDAELTDFVVPKQLR